MTASPVEPLSAARADYILMCLGRMDDVAAIRDGDHIVLARMTEAQVREKFCEVYGYEFSPSAVSTWLDCARALGLIR